MTTVSHGKPYAGNPHVRFEEGASESAKPSRNALLHNTADYPESIYAHTLGFGAGEAISVGYANEIGSGDCIGVQFGVPPLAPGGFTLVIPWSWGIEGEPYSHDFTTMRQAVSVTAAGVTTISKGGLFTIRGVNE